MCSSLLCRLQNQEYCVGCIVERKRKRKREREREREMDREMDNGNEMV
jgi:hypothetical protein